MRKTLKWMILALILTMAFSCAAFAEEEADYAERYPESLVYDSNWACGGTLLEAYCEDEGFRVRISQHTGEMLDELLVWEYSPYYNKETGALDAPFFGSKQHGIPAAEGYTWETEYDDGAAGFVLQENGKLLWKDEKEDAGAGMEFVNIGRFEGSYVCDRAWIEILWDADDVYVIDIHWANSAFESCDWALKGTYQAGTDTLEALGMASVTTYDENGNVVSVKDVDENGCFASFSFNEDHQLIWTSSDGAGDGLVFEEDFSAG